MTNDSIKAQELDGTDYDEWGRTENNDIQTTTNTQYYLVIKGYDARSDYDYVADVLTWTGYNNAPDAAALADNAVAYAVTHDTTVAGGSYDVADVVVFETDPTHDHDTFFVYEFNNYEDVEYVWAIGYDAEGAIADDRIDVDNDFWFNFGLKNYRVEFYEIYDNGTATYIGDNFARYGIYAGTVDTSWDIEGINYIQVNAFGTDNKYIYADAPIYQVIEELDGDYDVVPVEREDVAVNDQMIVFTDDKGNVEYAILVEKDVTDEDYIDDAQDLYDAIVGDATTVPVSTLDKLLAMAEAMKKLGAAADATDVQNLIDDLNDYVNENTTTAAERTQITTAVTDLNGVLAAIDKAEAIAEKQAAYDELIDQVAENNKDNPSAAWPEGAVEAAKEAVAGALAGMDIDDIEALTPSTTDNIWNDVIVPVVSEAQAAAGVAATTAAVKQAVESVTDVNPADGDAASVKNAIALAVQVAGNTAGGGDYTYAVDLGDTFDAIENGSVRTIPCTVTVSGTGINSIVVELTITVTVQAGI